MGGRKNQFGEGSATARCYRLGQVLGEVTISSPCYFAFLRAKKKKSNNKRNVY